MTPGLRASRVRYAACFGALIVFTAAHAQTPEPPVSPGSTESVTVHSRRQEDWTLSQRFLGSLLRPSYALKDQFATWKRPVCLRVNGMPSASAHIVMERIRSIAEKIGAPLDRNESCAPNVVIIVSQEPQTILNALKAKRTFLFAVSPVRDLQMHYPVQVWYYSLDRDYNGQYWPDVPLDGYGDTSNVLGLPAMKSHYTNLETGIQPEMRLATIIVDSAAIRGMALGTFADYLALLSLTQAPVTGQCQPAPSIANLFLTDCDANFHTTSLSHVDLAMLTSIYQTPDEPERLQKVRIINNMRNNLEMAQQK